MESWKTVSLFCLQFLYTLFWWHASLADVLEYLAIVMNIQLRIHSDVQHTCAVCCTDTEGSFMVERVVEITDACIRHLRKLGNNGTAAQKDAVSQSLSAVVVC